jgi:hypothetical protein
MIEDRILRHKESIHARYQCNGHSSSNTLPGQLCNGIILVAAQLSMPILIAPNPWQVYHGLKCINPNQVPTNKGQRMPFGKAHIHHLHLERRLRAE